jgi:cell division protein FtsW
MDRKLLYGVIALITIGMIMIYSSSSVIAESRFGSHLYFLKRQLLWMFVAIAAGWAVWRVDLKKYASLSVPLLIFSLILLVVSFIMPARNGAHRWLFIGPLTIQPSEIFKLVVIFYLAFSLSLKDRDVRNIKALLYPYAPLIGTGLILVVLQPALGSAMTIGATVIILLFLAGMRLVHLLGLILPLSSLMTFMIFGLGYKKDRVIDYLAAVGDPLQGSYQNVQAVLAMGAGGIFGAGLGDGRQKLFFLPYPYTDFIYASIGEELGLLGLLTIMALYYFIIWRGIKIAFSQPDTFGYLLAMGIISSIFMSVIINVGVVTTLLPTTGIPLPFISYGGSALLASVLSVAVLLNLSTRKGKIVR